MEDPSYEIAPTTTNERSSSDNRVVGGLERHKHDAE